MEPCIIIITCIYTYVDVCGPTLQSDHYGCPDVEFSGGRDYSLGNLIAANDAPKDVDKYGVHLRQASTIHDCTYMYMYMVNVV